MASRHPHASPASKNTPDSHLLCSQLLHQPVLLPHHLVLLTQLAQQLLRAQRGERRR